MAKAHQRTTSAKTRAHVAALMLASTLTTHVATVQAQSAPLTPAEQLQLRQQLDQQTNISRDRITAPLPRTPNFDLRIQAPEKSAVPKAIEEIQFDVKGFEFDGMELYSPDAVSPLFADIVGQKVSLEPIRKAVEALENRYREGGYFLTRVFIPPQQVKDGVFRIRVIEGAIGQVFVEGSNEAINAQVQALAQSLIGKKPIDLASLERVLLLINDIPGASGSGVLRQGTNLGSSDLVITTAPAPDIHLMTLNNTGSNATGPVAIGYNATLAQPFGLAGSLNAGITGTGSKLDEVRSTVFRYSTALGGSGLQGSIGALASRAHPGSAVARALGLESDTYSISGRLRYPIQRSRASSVYLDAGVAYNRSDTRAKLADGDLAASLNKGDKSTVIETTLSWALNGWLNGTQNLNFSVFHGTTLFSAISDSNDPYAATPGFEPRFVKTSALFTRTQPLSQRVSLQAVFQNQYTRDKLAAGELTAFGGPFVGRGFDPASIIGDRGWGGLLELRYDSDVQVNPTIGKIQFYTSYDHAHTRVTPFRFLDRNTGTFENGGGTESRLTSRAIGMRFPFLKDNLIDLQLADALRDIRGDGLRRSPRVLLSALVRF